jgi:ADP-heptose:LPS heptosyltransferase
MGGAITGLLIGIQKRSEFRIKTFPILQLVIQSAPILIRRLLIRPGAIGDFIVSLPALTAFRADYTEVWCKREIVPLARFADRAVALADTGIDRLGLLNDEDAVERLRLFDSIISWYGTGNADFRRKTAELNLPIHFLPSLPSQGAHAVDFYNAQAREYDARPESRFPMIECPSIWRSIAAIHPFASGPRKQAPLAVFESIADRLKATMPVEWIRGPEDVFAGSRYFDNLYELACWLRGARVFVGNDSGISHLAAAVGTPSLVLFSVADQRVWAPRGPSIDPVSLKLSETFDQREAFE